MRLPCISLALLLCWFSAAAAQVRVALLTGDAQSAAAIGAVNELRRDAALSNVTVRVFPGGGINGDDRQFVGESDIVIGFTRYGALIRSLEPQIREAAERGAILAGVGGELDPDYAAMGFKRDAGLAACFNAGGQANLAQMVRAALSRRHMPGLAHSPPVLFPECGFYDPATRRPYARFEDCTNAFLASRPHAAARPWVGVYFSRDSATSGQTELLSSLEAALEARGFNVICGFGYPADAAIPVLFLDSNRNARIEALVGLTLKIGNVPEKLAPLLSRLDVPVLNAIALNSQSRAEWERSPSGLEFIERSWQVGSAELAGAVAPTIVASKEKLVDVATGQSFTMTLPIPERVARLADRVMALVRLRREPPAGKRIAVIYYNYPPGGEGIGASYLNVMPQSLMQILNRLRAGGYDVGNAPASGDELASLLQTFGSNPGPGTNHPAGLDLLARSGRVPLMPVTEYRAWFDRLPAGLREDVTRKWGDPGTNRVMLWHDDSGTPFLVLPILRWGNVVFGAQPTRGWDQDAKAVYHDVTLPPHHQYLAFYLWLQKNFHADAMVHVGTHATHEWLPGKEVGFTAADTGEVIVGAVPQFYPYIVDDVGEGLQAKRRAMAAIITHLPPPMDRASLAPDLREIAGLIHDLDTARMNGTATPPPETGGNETTTPLPAGHEVRSRIAERCGKIGLLRELGITLKRGALLGDAQIGEIEHHLKTIGERMTPFGMHTLGGAPDEAGRAATAEAILSMEPGLSPEEHARRKAVLMSQIEDSARAEMDALSAGLAGRCIAAGPGNDPLRNPGVLPTGKNFYGFDPARMPSPATYAAGSRLAADFVESYRKRHDGQHPDRLVFNLWGTETSRHEGVMEAQILALMGVRPKWDARGRVQGVDLISREELGRPRVDVTVIPSGLYRDLFPVLMQLMDQAVNLVKTDHSGDNPLLKNIATARKALESRGVAGDVAERLASVRLFSVPPGSYGTGLEHAIQREDGGTNEQLVAGVFFNRMSHLFGQGFWGTRGTDGTNGDLSPALLRLALRDAKAAIHSRSSYVYGAIDSDDFYQYLGGTAMAVRQVNGMPAETFVADLSRPDAAEILTLDRYMGREMRARYLNPRWVGAMMKEGYAGARMIRQVTDNLWGWQVTTPEAMDSSRWQEMHEMYVEDRHKLGVREQFAAAGNLAAYQAIVDRLAVAAASGRWQAAPEAVDSLRQLQKDLAPSVAAGSAAVRQQAMKAAPPASRANTTGAKTPVVVKGRVLENVRQTGSQPSSRLSDAMQDVVLGVVGLMLLALGWAVQSRHGPHGCPLC
jgi:cobaltochelatase CobN